MLSAQNDLEESYVFIGEEVQAAVGATVVLDVVADASDDFDGDVVILETGEKIQVSTG